MRLPRVRFTLRSMMVGVAVVAGILWGAQTRRGVGGSIDS